MSARDWIEKSGYSAALGVRLDALDDTNATLRLPYSDGNSNPGQALHGGCAASLGILGGQTLARAALACGASGLLVEEVGWIRDPHHRDSHD